MQHWRSLKNLTIRDTIIDGVRIHVQDGVIYHCAWRGPLFGRVGSVLKLFAYPMTQLKNGRLVWGRPIECPAEWICYCAECCQDKEATKPERSPYMKDVNLPSLVAAKLRGAL